jgi:hypothetical protein
VNGKANRQRKERQARGEARNWQEVSKERGRRKKHRGSDTMSCNDRIEEAARADCGTRQGWLKSKKHGLERWRQQAKGRVQAGDSGGVFLHARYWRVIGSRYGATGSERTCCRAHEVRRLARRIPIAGGGGELLQLSLSLLEGPVAPRGLFSPSARCCPALQAPPQDGADGRV